MNNTSCWKHQKCCAYHSQRCQFGMLRIGTPRTGVNMGRDYTSLIPAAKNSYCTEGSTCIYEEFLAILIKNQAQNMNNLFHSQEWLNINSACLQFHASQLINFIKPIFILLNPQFTYISLILHIIHGSQNYLI